jgi:hypothetical protein
MAIATVICSIAPPVARAAAVCYGEVTFALPGGTSEVTAWE